MKVTRRQFVKGGVAAFTVTYAAPEFLCDIARAQGAHARNLVVLYLSGGNDALSMLIPYNDQAYYDRRGVLAVPAATVLQIGTDSSGKALGLHPRLNGLRQIFRDGRLALIQRTGYPNQSRSHFQGTDIWSTADPANSSGLGWVGRYLDLLPSPVDALVGWNTTGSLPRVLQSNHVAIPAIPSASGYAFSSPNPAGSAEAAAERATAIRINSHIPVDRPQLAFVYGSAQAAMATLDRVASVASYTGTVTYPNGPFGLALSTVAGAMVRSIGTKIFYVTTGGFDTHAQQGVNAGSYFNLMATLNDGVSAFYNDLRNQGLLEDTLLVTFSEFGRRIDTNGSAGTDHGAATVMMALGGRVQGGLYGTAPSLGAGASNGTLENNSNDIHFETDFRSVYARVIDEWLGADSRAILGADFRNPSLTFV